MSITEESDHRGMWRARVERNYVKQSIDVELFNTTRSGYVLYPQFTVEMRTIEPEHAAEAVAERRPLELSEGSARALLQSLTEFFGGRPVTVTDREDLLVERRRVDKLQDALVHIIAAGAVADRG